jgi:hypothetical protein
MVDASEVPVSVTRGGRKPLFVASTCSFAEEFTDPVTPMPTWAEVALVVRKNTTRMCRCLLIWSDCFEIIFVEFRSFMIHPLKTDTAARDFDPTFVITRIDTSELKEV